MEPHHNVQEREYRTALLKMVDSRPDKKPRMDKSEALRSLDNQLQAIEHKVQAIRRQLASEEFPYLKKAMKSCSQLVHL